MNSYNGQRVGASAVALGLAQGAHDLAVDYMKGRRAFGRTLSEFQGLQWMMADSEIKLNAARLFIYRAACNARELPCNVKLPHMSEAAMAKYYTGHAAFEVVSESLQMFGAAGYSQDLPLERMLRDVRMFQIGGGTSQAQLNMVITHEPRRHPIDVVLFRSNVDPFEGPHESDLGWHRTVTGRVTVETLPLRHHEMLTVDGVPRLAGLVRKHLLR